MTSPRRPLKKTTGRQTPAKKATTKKAAAKKPAAKKIPVKKTASSRVTARDRKVVERREAGDRLEVIAKALKFRDTASAHQAYERALDKTLPPPPADQRRRELEQLRDREDGLWDKADGGDLASIHELALIHLERARLNATTSTITTAGPRRRGPVETATAQECERLADNAPALAAAALVLARLVDNAPEDGVAYATAARELRMSMSNLRGLAGLQAPDGRSEEEKAQGGSRGAGPRGPKAGGEKGGTVVDASVLEKLRSQSDRG